MNKVILIGNLTRDPEGTTVGNGAFVCKFGIAVNRRFADADGNKQTDFFNVNVWRAQGENCQKYLKKGSKVCVVGSIQIRNYEDKEGQKRTATDIVADEVQFLNRAGEGAGGGNSGGGDGGMQPVEDDTLPF